MRKLLFTLVAFLLFVTTAHATTYWTSSGASSTNLATCDGTSDPGSYCTTASILAALVAGDVIKFKNGTYATSFLNPLPSGTSASARTRMTCESIRGCIIQPTDGAKSGNIIFLSSGRSFLEIDGFKLSHANQTGTINSGLRTSDNVTFNNLYVHDMEVDGTGKTMGSTYGGFTVANGVINSTFANNYIHAINSGDGNPGAHGFYVRGDSNIIEHNEVTGHDGLCFQFYSSGDQVDNNIGRYNYCHNHVSPSAGGGIYAGGPYGTGNQAYGNIIESVPTGIIVRGSNTKIYNNSIYSVTNGMITDQACGGCEVKNNALPSESLGVKHSNITFSNNIATNGDLSTSATPAQVWIDPVNSSFSLLENSPGIDTGVIVTSPAIDRVGSLPDIGALEAPVRLSAIVQSATPGVANITFDVVTHGVRGGTGLQGCTTGNWAIAENGAGKTENSCTISGSNIVNVGVSANFSAGQSADDTDAYTRGILTDNVCVGDPNTGCKNASVRTYSATQLTNNAGGAVGSTYEALHYRCLNWYSGVSPSSTDWLWAEDATLRCPLRADGFGAVAVAITSSTAETSGFDFHYNRNGGAYAALTNTPSATAIAYAAKGAPSMADGQSIPAAILTDPHSDYVAGKVVASQTSEPSVAFNATSTTNAILLLKSAAAAAVGDVYCIQPAKTGSTVGSVTQTRTPCFEITKPAAGF